LFHSQDNFIPLWDIQNQFLLNRTILKSDISHFAALLRNSCNLLFLSCGNHLEFPPVLTSFPFSTKQFFNRVVNAKKHIMGQYKTLFFLTFSGFTNSNIYHKTLLHSFCVCSLFDSLKIQIPYLALKKNSRKSFSISKFLISLSSLCFLKTPDYMDSILFFWES